MFLQVIRSQSLINIIQNLRLTLRRALLQQFLNKAIHIQRLSHILRLSQAALQAIVLQNRAAVAAVATVILHQGVPVRQAQVQVIALQNRAAVAAVAAAAAGLQQDQAQAQVQVVVALASTGNL